MTMTCYNPRLAIDLGQTSGRTARQLMAPEANTPSEETLHKIEKEGPQLVAVLPPGPVCPGLLRLRTVVMFSGRRQIITST